MVRPKVSPPTPHRSPKKKAQKRLLVGASRSTAKQVVGHGQRQNPGRDDPAEESASQPIGLPSPALHAAIGNVKAAGSEAAEPVKKDPECRVWIHFIPVNSDANLQMEDFFQRLHGAIGQHAVRLHKEAAHLAAANVR